MKTYWHIDIFDISWSRRTLSHWHLYILCLHYSHSYYTRISTFTFPFITLGRHFRFRKIIYACDVLSPSMKFSSNFRSQKGDCIAGVNYLKGVFALFGPRPPVFISGPQLPNPIKISTSSTSSYLDPSHYDHVHITFNGLQVICFMFTYSCYI